MNESEKDAESYNPINKVITFWINYSCGIAAGALSFVLVFSVCSLTWHLAQGADAIRVYSLILLAGLFVIGVFYFLFAAINLTYDWNGLVSRELRKFGTFTLGLPIAALGSLALVVLLPAVTQEKLQVEVPGFLKIEGPTIQILLWVVCFSTIVGSIKLLSPGEKTVGQNTT